MEVIESWQYSNPDGSADITLANGSIPDLAGVCYPIAGTSGNPSLTGLNSHAIFTYMGSRPGAPAPDRHPIRLCLELAGVGSDATTGVEDIYLVHPQDLLVGGVHTKNVKLLLWGRATYTFGTKAITGGRTSHVYAKSISWSSKGGSEAFGGGVPMINTYPGVGISDAGPAGLVIYDIGPAIGVVRVPALGASSPATGVAPMHMRYR